MITGKVSRSALNGKSNIPVFYTLYAKTRAWNSAPIHTEIRDRHFYGRFWGFQSSISRSGLRPLFRFKIKAEFRFNPQAYCSMSRT